MDIIKLHGVIINSLFILFESLLHVKSIFQISSLCIFIILYDMHNRLIIHVISIFITRQKYSSYYKSHKFMKVNISNQRSFNNLRLTVNNTTYLK